MEYIDLIGISLFSIAAFIYLLIWYLNKQHKKNEKMMVENTSILINRLDELEEKINKYKGGNKDVKYK